MPDGTVYYPSKSGSIDVDSRKHAAQLRSPNSAKNLELLVEIKGMPHVDVYRECPKCLFAAWDWSKQCSRCGTLLDESDRATDEPALASTRIGY
jgi:hypothetical protein